MGKIFKEFNEEKWEQVRTHPYFGKLRENTLAMAEEFMRKDPRVIKFSMIHSFVASGNRERFEGVYDDYMNRLNCYFVSYMLTLDDMYIEPLADIIWNICDFESWSIPAHVKEELSIAERRKNLDLCSTISASRIAEVLYFIGDKLPALVQRRAKEEIQYRIIDSYRDATVERYWWLEAKNNRSAVCIASILTTYLCVATEDEIKTQLPRMMKSADCYLSGFEEDGCCLEGYAYWNYGFSYFCKFASLLNEYTDGRINYFEREKVRKIALFQESITLNENQCISFSDSTVEFMPLGWLSHFLKGIYPELRLPKIPPSDYAHAPLRHILWQNPELSDATFDASEPARFEFENAQWFIYRDKDFALGCKAGHNKEPHNHNDVGSFIISKGGKVGFCDPGVGQYTRQYFSSERFSLMLCSSRGHSVPIINGEYQKNVPDKSTVLISERNRYAFNMEKVYRIECLKSLVRDFECTDTHIRMTDTYEFTEQPTSVVERFVSLVPFEVGEGKIASGNSTMYFDKARFSVSTGSETVDRKGNKRGEVYYADLTVISPKKNMTFEFIFD